MHCSGHCLTCSLLLFFSLACLCFGVSLYLLLSILSRAGVSSVTPTHMLDFVTKLMSCLVVNFMKDRTDAWEKRRDDQVARNMVQNNG